ncbi:MAG: Rossmann-like and DUF2520 domain-containing protein [Pseudomonadota bacterium]
MAATLNIIGAGHVGSVLGKLFAERRALAIQDVLTRSADSAARAVAFIGQGRACASLAAMAPADVWMLAVPDDHIAAVSMALARAQALDGSVVFHCSGAKSSAELAGAGFTASVHPIRSFADPTAVAQSFAGTWCGIEGHARAVAVLEAALHAIGAQTVPIDAAAKTVYHAASVFASNYLVTVLDCALRAYQAAGIPEQVARELARPLASESLANVFRLGPELALSGPIARGDFATVARQRAAVSAWDAPTGALYAALVAPTTALADRKKEQA